MKHTARCENFWTDLILQQQRCAAKG
nr:hypothetical protein [Streptomyces sp. QHH-9511]